ncbi:MAG TPA: acyl carrier protein, partial [Humisphaera sp.]
MSQPSTAARVRRVAADVFGLPEDQVTPQASPATVEGWDSVQHLNFVLAVEQEFGVQIPPEEIEGMQSVGAAIELAERLAR